MNKLFSILKKEFLDNLDVRQGSKELYSRILKLFAEWVVNSGRNIKELKRADIIEYKSYLIRTGKTENTIDSYLSTIRSFYEYTELIGEHDNIAAGIKLKHKSKGYRKGHFSLDEIKKLYASMSTDTLTDKRDYAIINLMLRTGMRCIEVSRLRVCDINERNGKYDILIQRKGDEVRKERIGVSKKAMQPVIDYLNYRGVGDTKDPVFVTNCTIGELPMTAMRIGRIVKSYLIKSGIYSNMKTAHSLRHTAAVMAILNKVPIKEVQIMLGHKRIETTELYLKSIEDDLRLDNPAARALDDAF